MNLFHLQAKCYRKVIGPMKPLHRFLQMEFYETFFNPRHRTAKSHRVDKADSKYVIETKSMQTQ